MGWGVIVHAEQKERWGGKSDYKNREYCMTGEKQGWSMHWWAPFTNCFHLSPHVAEFSHPSPRQ